MGIINSEIKKIIRDEHIGFVATASRGGVPNVSPKGSIRVWDDNTLIFIDFISVHTRKNIQENPHIAVDILSFKDMIGYQLHGKAELIDHGIIYNKLVSELKRIEPEYSEQIYVVRINVEEVSKQVVPPIVNKICRL